MPYQQIIIQYITYSYMNMLYNIYTTIHPFSTNILLPCCGAPMFVDNETIIILETKHASCVFKQSATKFQQHDKNITTKTLRGMYRLWTEHNTR